MSSSLGPHGLYSPWNSPGENPGVGSLSLLQGIFPTQGSNPGLPHCRRILYQLSHKGRPLALVAGKVWHNVTNSHLKVQAQVAQSCPTLCNPIDGSPPGSPAPGSLQARTLEWVAISFSNAWKWKVKAKPLSRVWLLATPWTPAHQAPPSRGFSRQEQWSGLPLPSPTSHLKDHQQRQSRWRTLIGLAISYAHPCSALSSEGLLGKRAGWEGQEGQGSGVLGSWVITAHSHSHTALSQDYNVPVTC